MTKADDNNICLALLKSFEKLEVVYGLEAKVLLLLKETFASLIATQLCVTNSTD